MMNGQRWQASLAISPQGGAFGAALFSGEWEKGVRAAQVLGYDAVDLSIRDPTDERLLAAARLAPDLGLKVAALATGPSYLDDGLFLGMPAGGNRDLLIARLRHITELAAELGALVIVGSIRGTLVGDERWRREQFERMLQDLADWARRADAVGVSLVLEPINRYESNCLNTVAEVIEVIEQVGLDNLGVLADTFHMNIEERSLAESIRLAGPRLRHLQIADSNRRAPGQGHIDFGEVATALREIGYPGFVAVEIQPRPDSETAAAEALGLLRTL